MLAALAILPPSGADEEEDSVRSPFLGPGGLVRTVVRPEFRDAPGLLEDLATFGVEGLGVALIGPDRAPPEPGQPAVPSQLLLEGPPEVLARAREVLAFLDVPRPAVLVSLLAVEVQCVALRDRGGHAFLDRTGRGAPDTLLRGAAASFEPESFLRSALTGALPFTGTSVRFANQSDDLVGEGAFELVLRMLAEEGGASVLAWPTVLVSEGEEGAIASIDRVTTPVVEESSAESGPVVTTTSAEVGILLSVVPILVGPDAATLDLVADLRVPTAESPGTTPAAGLAIARRTVATRVTVRDREALLVGGIRLRRQVAASRGIPKVSSVPGLEVLGSSRSTTVVESELVLLVRARVVRPGPTPAAFLPPGEARRLEEASREDSGVLGEH